MPTISLNPQNRTAVRQTSAAIKVTGGEDLTGCVNGEEIKYQKVQQVYLFEYNDGSTTSKKTINNAKNNNGEITTNLTGLNSGSLNTIKLTISYSYEYKKGKYNSSGELVFDPNWTTKEETLDPVTINIYTTTGTSITSNSFWKNGVNNIKKGAYIDNHITTDNVNDWLNQLVIWSSWYHQENYYENTIYDTESKIVSVTVSNLSTSNASDTVTITAQASGEDITADWYRKCGNACGLSNMNEIKGLSDEDVSPADATYITAQHFINLASKVTDFS